MNRIAACLVIVCVSTSQPARGAEYLFGDPVNLGFPISSSQSDVGHLSRDGLSLYVSQGHNFGTAKLYVTHRASLNDSWGPLDFVDGEINDGGSVGIATTTADEHAMFFSGKIAYWSGGVRRGGLGRGDIWLSERLSTDSSFGDPTNVGAPINTKYLESDPSISADGLMMVFASNRPNGFGATDLWESRRASIDATWQEPQNLGPQVNHAHDHQTPTLSADGLTLIYSVAANGLYADLWAVTRNDVESPWNSPVNLGGKINTLTYDEFNPQLSTDGSTLYYSQWTNSQEFDIFEVPLLPFEAVPLIAGSEAYSQNFDEALGSDGKAKGTILPIGWTVSDNGTVFNNATNRAFPVGTSLGSGGNPIFNAGAEGDSDRTLAIGVRDRAEGGMIQLLADVTDSDATSLQLQFAVEAWDARKNSRTDDPGQGAFIVHVDIDRGDGYETFTDLGTVKTDLLATPTDAHLDKKVAKNRFSFDSGPINGSIPAGSKLRVHWHVDRDAQTNNWVFGLDNVNLTLLGGEPSPLLMAGDADQDLDFDQLDLVQAHVAAKYLSGQAVTWGEGDWDGAPGGAPGNPPPGNELFDQLDVIAALGAGTYLTGPYAAIQVNGQLGDSNIFKATFGGSFGSVSFGNVAQAGLSEEFLSSDLTVVGSLAGGGDIGAVDLVYVPEPASALLLAVALVIGTMGFSRGSR